MHEWMASQVSFNRMLIKDEYLENAKKYRDTETVSNIYFQKIFDEIKSRQTISFMILPLKSVTNIIQQTLF